LFLTVGRVVNFASNGRLGELEQEEMVDDNLEPEQSRALYEVLSILLRNIVQHSGVHTGQLVTYSFHRTPDSRRVLRIVNKVESETTAIRAIEQAQSSISKPFDLHVLDRSPGRTGLGRIRALLNPYSHLGVEINVGRGKGAASFMVTVGY
jgi:hypothetical protein